MDMNAMLAGVSESERQRLMMMLEDMQIKEQVTMYNSLVERCFNNCVTSFRSKTLDDREEKCITRCTTKFIKASARAGQAFQAIGMQPGQGMPGAPGGGV
uniref:Mitochondrial import inner membrane translocase subunit n=1 Tax=Guillardia theta TaxID=55529 RepID=A2AX41_GUITH|nr:translocator of the inner mitochondrial membrane 9 [Guillardia theta]|mmetsp:Transcript_26126/g.85913  ORF Transcript_26126/g.85913 Transcript_26126/m.85913 type:complete len:100 (-) Transcript_26126:1740-2039(-)